MVRMLQKFSNSKFKYAVAVAVSLISVQVMPMRAIAQGMAESTSVSGAAAGLGSGIGAGTFKLFNNFSNQLNNNSKGVSSSASSTSSRRSLQPTVKETPAELNSRAKDLLSKADTAQASGDSKSSAKALEVRKIIRKQKMHLSQLLAFLNASMASHHPSQFPSCCTWATRSLLKSGTQKQRFAINK
jgi:hypothetical protein